MKKELTQCLGSNLLFACLMNMTIAAQPPTKMGAWKILAPIPDPVGFAGMFAGVLGGRLLAGGGSQFATKPIWLGGNKSYSDRIFSLSSMMGSWREEELRLPSARCFFAHVATREAIYLAGGMGAEGSFKTCYRLVAEKEGLALMSMPDLSAPLSHAVAGILGDRMYVIGGLKHPGDKSATTEVWSLKVGAENASEEKWRRERDYPGPGVFAASAATDSRFIYVLSGLSFDATGGLVPAKGACRFDSETSTWQLLPNLPEPRAGAASTSFFFISRKTDAHRRIRPDLSRSNAGPPRIQRSDARTRYRKTAMGKRSDSPAFARG